MRFIIFEIENQYFAIELACVLRVVQSVAITSVPKAPEGVSGMIKVHGIIIPVMNMRKFLQIPERELDLSDQFIICSIAGKETALWVDRVLELADCSTDDLKTSKKSLTKYDNLLYAIKHKGNIILAYDWENLLNPETLLQLYNE